MTRTKSKSQAIFDAAFMASLELSFDTYDRLPAEGTDYPFVFVGESITNDRRTKRHLFGDVIQTVHVYAMQRNGQQPEGTNRSEFTGMMDDLKTAMRSIKRADGFFVRPHPFNDQILIDTSTSATLLHGVIEATFTLN